MPLKPLGKPPYLLPDEVEQDDVVEIIDKPYIVPAEKSKWGKERGKAQVKILRNNNIRTWTMNNTTWDRLIGAFGEDPDLWLNKKVKIRKEVRNVSGVDKDVLFGAPHHEPQQKLDPQNEEPFNKEFLNGFKQWLDWLHLDFDTLTSEQKSALASEYAKP